MKRLIAFAFLTSFLSGCATVTKPVTLNPSFWENRQQNIGVAVTAAKPPTAYMLGNQGLLDIVINRANAKDLIAYLEKLDVPRLKAISQDFVTQLQARGFNVKVIDQPIDNEKLAKFSGTSDKQSFSDIDYRSFKSEGIDRLIVISVDRVGTSRNYYGFIPTNSPQADLALSGKLVDLHNNELLWYAKEENKLPVSEPWDQPTSFENITAAIQLNAEQSSEKFEQSFFAGPVQ